MSSNNSTSKQYSGWRATPLLWNKGDLFGLQQLEITSEHPHAFQLNLAPGLRLGMRAEQFVFHELEQQASIEILGRNIQINQHKHTLGELDCLLKQDNQLIHLEIVYKFYVYDPGVSNTPLECWIGPNRRDSLVEKLTKLKEKQLPLLQHEQTQKTLLKMGLAPDSFQQKVNFKAQLYLPLTMNEWYFEPLNNKCIIGFYVHEAELCLFTDCKFYIPAKVDWLIEVHPDVHWLNYKDFLEKSTAFMLEQRSILCWKKDSRGNLQKFFLVWW